MDPKSSGILGACLIIAALIIALVPRTYSPAPVLASPQIGRYRMSGVPGHAYVVDTATGQVWEDFVPANQGSPDAGFKQPKVR